jgi:hypothetical protein
LFITILSLKNLGNGSPKPILPWLMLGVCAKALYYIYSSYHMDV